MAVPALAFASTPALAHVTIVPTESSIGVEERYTVRVPSERGIATVALRLEIPAEVTVVDFLAKPGWDRQIERGGQQQIVAVTWTGGNIGPGEFDEFGFEARNPTERGDVVWRAYQTYADGARVEWTGDETSETPAPVTRIKPSGATPPERTGETSAAQRPASSPSDASLFVALIALVLAALALILAVAGLARRRWPA